MSRKKKKKKSVQRTGKKAIKRIILAIVVCVLCLISGSWFWLARQNVSAHPMNSIVLGLGKETEFEVFKDATELREPAVTSNALYKGYVQGEEVVPILEQEHVEAFGSNNVDSVSISWAIQDVIKTTYGNYFVLYSSAGTNKGGVAKVSVYSKSGKLLATDAVGSLADNAKRVNTRILSAKNNQYLLGVNDGTFFKYQVSNESNTGAKITRSIVKETAGENPAGKLTVHYFTKMLASNASKNTDSLLTGVVFYDEVASHNGSANVKHRVPVGKISVTGWENGSFKAQTQYQYSLGVQYISEINSLFKTDNPRVQPLETYFDDAGHIYGSYFYSTASRSQHSVQVFDGQEVIDTATKKKMRKLQYKYSNADIQNILILKDVSTNSTMYFLSEEKTETKLMKVNLSTYQDEVVKTYPKGTLFNLTSNGDGSLSYFGTTSELSGEFENKYYKTTATSPYYFIQGIIRDATDSHPFKINSVRAFDVTSRVIPEFMINSGERVLLFGRTYVGNSLIDKVNIVGTNGAMTSGTLSTKETLAYIGTSEIKDDYDPIIKPSGDIMLNLSDLPTSSSTKNSLGWTAQENWLITGKNGGTLTSANAIKVFDNSDTQNKFFGNSVAERQAWLEKRINRNPRDVTADIEWSSLGYNPQKTGPFSVTFFVADSQGGVVSTSRKVTNTTKETISSDDYYLDAQNFSVPLKQVKEELADEQLFKNLAKTMAWNNLTGIVEEDGEAKKFSAKVSVNATQLKAVQDTTIARPYPIDVTFEYQGRMLINRVWVFVTTKNTVVNQESGLVIYGDDYELPLYSAKHETPQKVYANGNIKVYDFYDDTHEKDEDCLVIDGEYHLPSLADKLNVKGLDVPNITIISHATKAETVGVQVAYTLGTKKVETTLDVTITPLVLVHARVIVLNPDNRLEIPKTNQIEIENINTLQPEKTSKFVTRKIGVGSDMATSYTALGVAFEEGHDQLKIEPINLGFYQAVGYVLTESDIPHEQAMMERESLAEMMVTEGSEYWLTLYVEPNVKTSVYLSLATDKLHVYYANINQFTIYIDGEKYKSEIKVKNSPTIETIILDVPVDEMRNKISVKYLDNSGDVKSAIWNDNWAIVTDQE